jgi:DNA-binding protein HU-beta
MTTTRTEVISRIESATGISNGQAADALRAFENIVAESLAAGAPVRLPGFLTFDVVDRAERQGRNPRTGAAITIPAGRGVRVSAGSALKAAAKGKQ